MKTSRMFTVALSVGFMLPVSQAFAQTFRTADTIPPVKVTLDLGYLNAAGNTDVSSLSAGEILEYRAERMEVLQGSRVIYGNTDDVTTAEQISTNARISFLVAKFTGLFVGAGYERNRFAGIRKRFEENAGIAFRLLNMPMDTWLVELGGALNQQTNTLGIQRNYTSLRGATTIRHSFTKTAFMQENFEVLPTTDDWNDTRINNEIALVAPISGHVALKISYLIKFDNVPEPGFKKSDRILTSGIQVVF